MAEDDPTDESDLEESSKEPEEAERRSSPATEYSATAIVASAIVGLVVAVLSVAWAAGGAVSVETIARSSPAVEDGGIGADWVAGNTVPALDFLIALVHAADVLMGVFILVILFVHWASFRRIAARMRPAGRARETEGVAADGGPGAADPGDGETG